MLSDTDAVARYVTALRMLAADSLKYTGVQAECKGYPHLSKEQKGTQRRRKEPSVRYGDPGHGFGETETSFETYLTSKQ
eukprot:6179089-Pleurochrysis_carterae.AAC.2